MSRTYEQPTEAPAPGTKMGRGGDHETVTTHPAYGMIGASRVSANPGYSLFGSDFRHRHFMTVRITRGQVRRGISNDWYGDGDRLIEVAMSESQWATFISTPNAGCGTPCTLEWVTGQGQLPLIPNPPERHEQFAGEFGAAMAESIKRLETLQKLVAAGAKTAADREAIKDAAFHAQKSITDSAPWVAKMFEENVEKRTSEAKTEVHAYIEQAIARRGLEALGAKAPIQLQGETDEETEE